MEKLILKIHSAANSLVYGINRTLKWSRKGYREQAAKSLVNLPAAQEKRIETLKKKYSIAFEDAHHQLTSLENYLYLDLLDQSARKFDWKPEAGLKVVDAGSKSFYYAAVLNAFFKPKKLIGIEIEGYCIYQDWHSRFDYAQYYISPYPHAEYRVMDFCEYDEGADVITYFYPFVTRQELVDWTLPLKFFGPERIFENIHRNLKPGGFYWMVNHGEEEAEIAFGLVSQLPFEKLGHFADSNPLTKRAHSPVVSIWRKK